MKKIILSICIVLMGLNTQLLFANKINAKTLASVSNPDGFYTTEGTSFKFSRFQNLCTIQAIYYGETGRAIEKWNFNQFGLLSANRLVIGYTKGGLTALSLNGGKFSEYIEANEKLDVNHPEQQQDFKKLRALFPTQLVQCVAH